MPVVSVCGATLKNTVAILAQAVWCAFRSRPPAPGDRVLVRVPPESPVGGFYVMLFSRLKEVTKLGSFQEVRPCEHACRWSLEHSPTLRCTSHLRGKKSEK